MRCRRESAVAQRGNVSEEAGTTTHKRAPIALRRGENRLPAGLLIQPKEGTREKPAAFARKQRANSPKRPTFARELRDFLPPTLRRTTKQRKHRTSTAGVCFRMRAACAVAAVCDEPLCRSAFAQRDFGLPQGDGIHDEAPFPTRKQERALRHCAPRVATHATAARPGARSGFAFQLLEIFKALGLEKLVDAAQVLAHFSAAELVDFRDKAV